MSESDQKRPLIKGSPRPPLSNPSATALSYTQPTRSRNEVSVGTRGGDIKVVEFNGSAYPQPFLDPSIMQKRLQVEREWKAEQERIKQEQLEREQAGSSSRS
ncbi:hypothetical protein NHQ30_003437 [Ciborinia camelliae]|nr:hypothetical protein NHQ30_003437 [Ciborinia camelliae]